jgi:L-fuconolactonase
VNQAYDGPRIDAHLHIWERAASDYAWLGPEDELFADFPAERAAVELAASGIDHAILVQADDTELDTRYLLDVAEHNSWVAGVVGWVPLDDPARAIDQLDELASRPALQGIREMIHVKADREYLARRGVRDSLKAVADRKLAFDIPDAWPDHLHAVPALADALPDLTIVVDHLGKPPRSPGEFDTWRNLMIDCASRPNVVTKFSGLSDYSSMRGTDATRAVLDIALAVFGSSRICWGSDWPISTKFGDYASTWSSAVGLVSELSQGEQADLLFGAAARAYRVNPSTTTLEPELLETP